MRLRLWFCCLKDRTNTVIKLKNENQNIEYKSVWKDEYLKWVCGFANAKGGIIYIGIDDSGKIIGLRNYKKLMKDLPNKIRDILGILVEVNLFEEQNKFYIELKIEPYSDKCLW